MTRTRSKTIGRGAGSGLFALGSIAILLSQRADNAVCLPAPDGHGGHVQKAETRIKQYRRAGRQATQQVTGLVEMFTAVQAIQVAGGTQCSTSCVK